MAKQRSHETKKPKSKKEQQSCGKIDVRKLEKKADRDYRIKVLGYDPAYVGGGAHGPDPKTEVKQKRRKSKGKLNKLRNQNVRNIQED